MIQPTSSAPSLKVAPINVRNLKSPIWHETRAWQTNLALILIGIGLFFLSHQLVAEYDSFTIGFSGVAGWSAILYVASVFIILTSPVNRYTFPIILAVAIVCRLAPLFADPFLSSDIYRYVWDGIVQHAHISPYRYVPGDPILTFLRAPNQEIFDNINRRDYAHTIYPPIAQALFYCITFISPTILAMKTAMVLFEGMTVYALVQILGSLGIRREQTLLYAWCPLLVWEIAGSGHLDSVAMAFITLALLFRLRRWSILAGLFLGLAVMTKLYPIVLLPAFLIYRGPPSAAKTPASKWAFANPANWDWKLPASTATVIAIGYAAYSGVGMLVFGFLGGYVKEEGMASGTRYFLLELAQRLPGLHNLPTPVFYVTTIILFTALTVWALKSSASESTGALAGPEETLHWSQSGHDGTPTPAFLRFAFAFACALMFLFSPHYAWYIAWLVPFFTVLPNLPILAYLMAFFYLFTTSLADGGLLTMFTLNKRLNGVVFLAFLIHLALRRRTIPGINFNQSSQHPNA